MIFYPQFYKRFGIVQASQLLNPRMPKLGLLELPTNSIFHYLTDDATVHGPATDEYLFRKITKPIPMMHITRLTDFKGMPRFVTQPIDQNIRAYHGKHRRYRLNRNFAAAQRDQMVPLVINYGWLAGLYRYQRAMFSNYNRWWNINATFWSTIGTQAAESSRQHFVVVTLPKVLPGRTDLRIAAEQLVDGTELESLAPLALESYKEQQAIKTGLSLESLEEPIPGIALEAINARMVRIFNTPESLVFLELWKWMGPQREKSLINRVKEEDLSKINLIFSEAGRWFVLNLGTVNQWRKATDEEREKNPAAPDSGLDPIMMQNRLLHTAMVLFQMRTVGAPEVKDAIQDEGEHAEQVEDQASIGATGAVVSTPKVVDIALTAVTAGGIQIQSKPEAILKPEAQTSKTVTGKEVIGPQTVSGGTPVVADDKSIDENLDRDLAALDEIMQAHIEETEDTASAEVLEVKNLGLDESITHIAKGLAAQGMLSAAELKRYESLATKYHSIVAPDGKRTLKEYIDIKSHEVQITESKAIKDIPSVLDKTMLKSSLHDFDTRYIREILPRDVAAMVMSIQRAGICVTDYQHERVERVTGKYDAYTVKLVPVDGAASTIRFHLPVIEDDGTYLANGSKYFQRKQRGDAQAC